MSELVEYTVHVNSDDESLAERYEIVTKMDPEQDRTFPALHILRQGSDVGEPTKRCRECSKIAQELCCGLFRSKVPSASPQGIKVSLETDICIPVCKGGQDSLCFIKAQQRIRIHCIKIDGREGYQRSTDSFAHKKCFNCGKQEPDGARYLTCDRCSVAFYCSKECQVEGWRHKGHKKGCHPIGETRAEYKK